MSKLKQYWDGLDAVPSLDESEIEESLDRLIHKLGRQKRMAGSVLLVLIPVLAFVGLFCIWPKPTEMLQCYVPLGEQRQLTLSDGTKVTLNSGSTLVYSDKFDNNQRKVFLNGQAAFEVTKNEHSPFVVSTYAFDVTVLGTVFDVSAYPSSSQASVVLLEGQVSIDYPGGKTLLEPGQLAKINKDGSLAVSGVEALDYFSWRSGGFVLKKASMSDIIELLERQYGLEVRYNYSEKFSDVCITAKSAERMSLNSFLQLLENLIPGMKHNLDKDNNTLELY